MSYTIADLAHERGRVSPLRTTAGILGIIAALTAAAIAATAYTPDPITREDEDA